MAENLNLNNVATFQNDTSAVNTVNTNFSAITTAMNDVLSRSGISPNQMSSTLDMNNNQIINLPFPTTLNSPARLQDVTNAQNITIITATMGTSGHTAPFLDGTNTWSGVQTFNTGILEAITNPGSFTTTNVFNSFAVATDNLDASGVGNVASAFNVYHGLGGSLTKGARQALTVVAQLLSPTSTTNTNRNYVGAAFTGQAVSNDGGGVGTEKGSIFGINPIALLNAAATNMAELCGGEFDISASAGSSVLDKWGMSIAQLSSDAVSGSRNDAAVRLANQAGSVGWKNGIQFGDGTNQFPVKSSGTLIKTVSGSVTTGIDFSATTFSGFAFLSPGFGVTSAGAVNTGVAGTSNGVVNLSGITSGLASISVNSTGNILTITQPTLIGVIGTTAGQLTLAGQTSGSAVLSCSATGGTLQMGAGNVLIDTGGNIVTNGALRIGNSTAPVSGGDTAHAYLFGPTITFGIFTGVGPPTISAAQGSLYLNTTGSTTSTRAYMNTNGSTGWTAITTAT